MAGLSDGEVATALQAAATAELTWLAGGLPDGDAVTPLLLEGRPVLAVPYAFATRAREAAAASEVVLTVSDPRLSGQRWKSLRLRARPRLAEDREGTLYCDALLEHELRKHPPSRALADTILLRRENWWYLPRLLLHLDVLDVEPFVERFGADELLLVSATGGRVHVDGVRVTGWGSSRLDVEPLGAEPLPGEASPDVLLLGHDFTEPDMERWDVARLRGTLSASTVVTEEAPVRPAVRGMPRLLERLRRHRDLRRGCLEGLGER